MENICYALLHTKGAVVLLILSCSCGKRKFKSLFFAVKQLYIIFLFRSRTKRLAATFFFLHLFYHLALPVAMNLRLVFIFALCGERSCVCVIICNNNCIAECLRHEDDQYKACNKLSQQHGAKLRNNDFKNMSKIIIGYYLCKIVYCVASSSMYIIRQQTVRNAIASYYIKEMLSKRYIAETTNKIIINGSMNFIHVL